MKPIIQYRRRPPLSPSPQQSFLLEHNNRATHSNELKANNSVSAIDSNTDGTDRSISNHRSLLDIENQPLEMNKQDLRIRRFATKFELNRISPDSSYGYAPKQYKPIKSWKKDRQPINNKVFTVKLTPLPSSIKINQNFSNSLDSSKTVFDTNQSSSTINAKITADETSKKITKYGSNRSLKRPMINRSSDDDLDEDRYDIADVTNKKSKIFDNSSNKCINRNDIIDFDADIDDVLTIDADSNDSNDISVEYDRRESSANSKGKRSTSSNYGNSFCLPNKKIKNNEIISSYSSTNDNFRQNKRKYSPDLILINDLPQKTKKRSHLEELERLTTSMNPSSFYSSVSCVADPNSLKNSSMKSNKKSMNSDDSLEDSATINSLIEKDRNSTIDFQIESESIDSDQDSNFDDQISLNEMMSITENDESANGKSIVTESSKAIENETLASSLPSTRTEEESISDERLYLIPSYIHTIEDHEYDKRKTKNRLNRFLTALKQINEEIQDENEVLEKEDKQR